MDEINKELDQLNYETAPVSNVPPANTNLPPRGHKFKIIGLVSAVVAILGGGGYFAYAQFYQSPERIWDTAFSNYKQIKSGNYAIEFSFKDSVSKLTDEEIASGRFGTFSGGEFTVGLTGEGGFVLSPEKLEDSDAQLRGSVWFKSGGFDISYASEIRKMKDNLFFKISDIPALTKLLPQDLQKTEWIKITHNHGDLATPMTDANNDAEARQIIDQIKALAVNLKPIKLGEVLGTDNIDGEQSIHYSARLDKEEIKKYLDSVVKIASKGASGLEGTKNQADELIDKMNPKTLEIWIGKQDKQIHQIVAEFEFPSIAGAALTQAQAKSRDAKRLADIRQIQTGLELFYNDHSRYPTATNGFPTPNDGNKQSTFSTYIATPPKAPTPADGRCSKQDNYYIYEQLENGASYKIRFCLGATVSGYNMGIQEATPIGIKTIQPMEELPPAYDSSHPAAIHAKMRLWEHNSNINISEPEGAVDLNKLMGGVMSESVLGTFLGQPQ